MRVVLDTNVLVSALLWRGAPYRCLLAIQAGLSDLVLSPPILDELEGVLLKKFGHTPETAREAIALLSSLASLVDVPGLLRVVSDDPADDKFLETAQIGRADYIISGDRHLLALGARSPIPVLTARAFLDRLV